MIDDKYILENFFGPSGKLNSNHSTLGYLQSNDPEVLEYLKNRYNDSESLRETFLRIKYNIEKRPICPICGNLVKWRGQIKYGLYNNTCGKSKCYCKYRENTIIKKYGSLINFGGLKESIEKAKKTKQRKYGDPGYNNRKQAEKTCLERYGKSYSSNMEHIKRVCDEKYGGIGGASKIILDKMKNTCLKRYGVDNYRKSKECVEKIIRKKKQNKTFVTSQIEEKCYNWLIKEFGEKNIMRQYVDMRYTNPINNHMYHCDFYVKPLDVFIEVQGHWVHGSHPYNPDNPKDVSVVNSWAIKKKPSYDTAIKTWTEMDVLKRNVAKQNNIKYYEMFDIKITEDKFIKNIKSYGEF